MQEREGESERLSKSLAEKQQQKEEAEQQQQQVPARLSAKATISSAKWENSLAVEEKQQRKLCENASEIKGGEGGREYRVAVPLQLVVSRHSEDVAELDARQ